MPTTFNRDWEQAAEAKFARDAEHRFLVAARRDKLFAAWAAGRMHLPDDAKDALVNAVLKVLDGKGHDAALLRLAGEVLATYNVPAPEAELAAALTSCATQAEQQLAAAPALRSDSVALPDG
jgi:hypothetical protein